MNSAKKKFVKKSVALKSSGEICSSEIYTELFSVYFLLPP